MPRLLKAFTSPLIHQADAPTRWRFRIRGGSRKPGTFVIPKSYGDRFMNWFRRPTSRNEGGRRRSPSRRARPELQPLESRVVLYSATGNAWPNPATITISFMPDGTDLGGVTSNLFGAFENKPTLAGRWQGEILRAAQAWAQQTNINFVVVPDDGAPAGAGDNQQGDPGHGDIRIGGYNFYASTLAATCQPPAVNNFGLAGNMTFNTGQTFNVGLTYDLFTVAAHEFGHALGLGESSATAAAIMFPTYVGRKISLSSDDIAGIRSIYSGNRPRSPDAYSALAPNTSLATAADLTSQINPSTLSALVPNLDISAVGLSDFYRVTVPSGTTGTFQVAAQSLGQSLLAPRLTVYSSSGTVLAMANGAGQYGARLTASVPNANAGQVYYIQVGGAEMGPNGTGRYALSLSFNGTAPPKPTSPIIAYANGTPLSAGGGMADQADIHYTGAAPIILGISPDTGASDSDGITSATRITVRGIAPEGETIRVYANGAFLGTTTSDANGAWTFDASGTNLSQGSHKFTATAIDPIGTVSDLSMAYSMMVDTEAPSTPDIGGIAPYSSPIGSSAVTQSRTPVFYGSTAPGNTVTLTDGSLTLGSVVADRNGHWDFTVTGNGLSDGHHRILARATDIAGNVSNTITYSLLVWNTGGATSDSVADLVVSDVHVGPSNSGGLLGSLLGGLLNIGDEPTIQGRAKANTLVAVMLDDIIVGVAQVDWLGHWSFDCSKLAQGTHKFSFRVYDQFGNCGADSGPVMIQV